MQAGYDGRADKAQREAVTFTYPVTSNPDFPQITVVLDRQNPSGSLPARINWTGNQEASISGQRITFPISNSSDTIVIDVDCNASHSLVKRNGYSFRGISMGLDDSTANPDEDGGYHVEVQFSGTSESDCISIVTTAPNNQSPPTGTVVRQNDIVFVNAGNETVVFSRSGARYNRTSSFTKPNAGWLVFTGLENGTYELDGQEYVLNSGQGFLAVLVAAGTYRLQLKGSAGDNKVSLVVPFDYVKGWDWEGQRGETYGETLKDGLDLFYQHIPGFEPFIQTSDDSAEVAGALNDHAMRLRVIRELDDPNVSSRFYSRCELKQYFTSQEIAANLMGFGGGEGELHYTKFGVEYVHEMRIKPASTWQRDNRSFGTQGADNYCSIWEWKQDGSPSNIPYRSRDATFRLRMSDDWVNIKGNFDPTPGRDYNEGSTGGSYLAGVHVPTFFDGNYHRFTIRVIWAPDNRGSIRLYYDGNLIWSRLNQINCYNENTDRMAPYHKAWLYDAGMFADQNSGSDIKELLVDYEVFGLYNSNGLGWTKYHTLN